MTARRPKDWRVIAARKPSGDADARRWRPVPGATMTIAEASALFCAGRLDIETARDGAREVYRVRAAELS